MTYDMEAIIYILVDACKKHKLTNQGPAIKAVDEIFNLSSYPGRFIQRISKDSLNS